MASPAANSVVEKIKAIYARAHGELARLAKERRAIVDGALKARDEQKIEEIRKRIGSV